MNSFRSLLLRNAQDVLNKETLLQNGPASEEIRLMRLLGRESAQSLGLEELSDEDCRLVFRLAAELFLDPTKLSKDLANELALKREDLVRLYRIIRNTRQIQDILTFESPLRRRVSFLRRELLPGNLPMLKAMFNGDVCQPCHVEFHPALMCNLRCRACPNVQSDSNGELQFLGYPQVGEPLNADRLYLIQDLFLDMGIESFSFGGGGEPSLSALTLAGVAHLRERNNKAEISLYTNGIFPEIWDESEYEILVRCLNKMRFSIDAADAREWSQYKGRPPEFFEILWSNIKNVVASKRKSAGITRIGASCLVSSLSYRNVEGFLLRARDAGLDFCDIKEVETCFGEKSEFKAKGPEFRSFFDDLMTRVRKGFFAPMDVVVDDRLLSQDENPTEDNSPATRCWIAIRGRMLTVGPYGELYPCSDAANPGSQNRLALKNRIGRLTAFGSVGTLEPQFSALWSESLPWRSSLTRANCAYCVPSHTNYNLAVDKLYEDWRFGILPEEQPIAGVPDHYLAFRGANGGTGEGNDSGK